jgi:hypothetical protein
MSIQAMYDHVKAPEDVIKDRNELADRVCRELELAGVACLPAGGQSVGSDRCGGGGEPQW